MGRPVVRRVALVAGLLGGLAAGAVTALLGTGAHLVDSTLAVGVARLELPAGLALAVVLVVATDTAVATATLRPAALVATGVGRAAVLLPLAVPDPGGSLVLTASFSSTLWALVAVLVPFFLVPLLSAVAARRARSATVPAAAAAA